MMATDSVQAVLTGLLAFVGAHQPGHPLGAAAYSRGHRRGKRDLHPRGVHHRPFPLPCGCLADGQCRPQREQSTGRARRAGHRRGGRGPRGAAFGLDGVSFVVSVITLAAIVARSPAAATQVIPDSQLTPRTAAQGPKALGAWQLVRHERLLQVLLLIVLVANLGSGGLVGVAFPALARGPFDLAADGYGGLLACGAPGGLIGVLAAAHFDPGRRPAIRASWLFLGAKLCCHWSPSWEGRSAPAQTLSSGRE